MGIIMKIENFYPVFRYIASKQLNHLQKKDASTWKSEWAEFFLNDLINFQYEDIIAVDFKEKQNSQGMDKGLKAKFQELDYMLSWVFLGAVPEDYFSMVFNKKGWAWRNHHITRQRLRFLKRKFNSDSDSLLLLDDKAKFCKHWERFIHRKWCIPDEIPLEEFEERFKGVEKLIAKRRIGKGGKGIAVFDLNETGFEEIYEWVLSQKGSYIVEEYHKQTGWLHKVNPSSLNTIRVATISINGKTDVIFSYLRVGVEGAFVDNIHSGGIRFPIDRHTGKVFKGMNYQIHDVEKHPDSGVNLYGETIPKWDEIIELCKKAHDLAPDSLHLVGWDVCLDEDDISLIEGNGGPGFPPIENPHEDWWNDMKNYLSLLEGN